MSPRLLLIDVADVRCPFWNSRLAASCGTVAGLWITSSPCLVLRRLSRAAPRMPHCRPATRSPATFVSALERAGATIVQTCRTLFPGRADLRADPERVARGAAHLAGNRHRNIDIFSCSTRLKSLEAIDELGRSFGAAAGVGPGDPSCRRTRPARRRGALASRCAAWRLEPRPVRPAPPALDEAHVVLPLDPRCRRGWRRRCSARRRAGRGDAGVQRRRRAGAVPRRRSSPIRCRGARAWPAPRGGAGADPRPEHAADRHARPRGRVAALVQRASPLHLAGRAHAGDRRLSSSPGCASRTAGADRPAARAAGPAPPLRVDAFAGARRPLLRLRAASPLYLESAGVLALAGFVARAAAVLLARLRRRRARRGQRAAGRRAAASSSRRNALPRR